MKSLIKFVLPLAVLGLLGGCGAQSKSQSDSSKTSSSKVAKSATSHSQSESNKSDSDSTSDSNSQSDQSVNDSNATSTTKNANTVKKSSHAVTQQTIASRISRLLSYQYAPQDLTMQFSQSASGTYTIQVQENHQSPNMKAQGADPNTSPTIAWFKTNTSGQLLKSTDGGVSYTVVGNAY